MRLPLLPLAAACVLAAVPALAQQSTYPTPKSSAGVTQAQLAPMRDTLTAAQQRLAQLGYHTSPTGQWNADTANAVQLFQSDHGLRPTGEVDLQTLAALGIDVNPNRGVAMLPPEPGAQTAMLMGTPEQEAIARFQNSPAYDLPIFTAEGDHPSPPQVRRQASSFEVMGMNTPLVVSPAGRVAGVSPAAPMEDLVR